MREFGVRAGVQGAGTFNDGEVVENALPAFYLGLFRDQSIFMSGFVSLTPGIEYMQNGYWTDSENLRRIHYIALPLALRLHFGPFHAQFGYSANVRIGERLLINAEDSLNNSNRSKTLDIPIQAGVGVKIYNFSLEGRFHYGFMDVNQGNQNAYLQLGVALSF